MKKVRYTGACDVVSMREQDWALAGVDAEEGDVFTLEVSKKGERVVELSDAAADEMTKPGNDFILDSEAAEAEADVYSEDADI